jgi:hypothetical protein
MQSFDADKLASEICKAGEDWADAEYLASQLEELKKVVLAELMNTGSGSVASREMESLAAPEYRIHIEGMTEARRKANRFRVRYKALETLSELRRTQESTKRAEMNLR